jgi:hypothetical protein
MNVPARRANGQLIGGQGSLNPSGRPANAIASLRERYLPKLPEYFQVLEKLIKSDNESMRLAAVRELLDRLVGKPQVVVESSHTRVDIGQLYLAALQRANRTTNSGASEGTGQSLGSHPVVDGNN